MYVSEAQRPSPAMDQKCRCHRGCARCRPIAPVLLWKRQAALVAWRERHAARLHDLLPQQWLTGEDRGCPICAGRAPAA